MMIRISKRGRHRLRIVAATLVGLLMAFPLIYILLGSLMSGEELSAIPPVIIPSSLHFSNYPAALSGPNQVIDGRNFLNSVIFTVCAVGLQWLLCISGGMALAKMRFRGSGTITVMLAVSLFIPLVTTLIPTFVVAYELGLINTYPGLILPIAAQTGFGTLLFRQYIKEIPEALFDAARI